MRAARAHAWASGWRASAVALALLICARTPPLVAQEREKVIRLLPKDETTIGVRADAALPQTRIPAIPDPTTVTDPRWELTVQSLGLDEAIRVTLANSQVVRVLAGVTATSSGATIYDAAITNTTIDSAKARFDPTVSVQNTFSRTNTPTGIIDPLDPSRALIAGTPIQAYDMNLGISKINGLGGTATMGVNVNPMRNLGGLLTLSPQSGVFVSPLNPQTPSSLSLGYTQPLLQGGGLRANLAPIIIARLNTERSFFQFKDSVQQSVRSVAQAYWSLVFARTDVWARRRQVEQGQEALNRAEGRLRAGFVDVGEVAQARTALANYKATLIAAEANVLNQEAALADLMGLPPTMHVLPMSPPTSDRLKIDWPAILQMAGEHRPDLIELQLILAADRQMLYQARNQARPKLDANMQYTWNGLEGTMPNGAEISTFGGSFTQWNLGVNFAVPLGLRQGRAAYRQQELILFRDEANLQQGILTTTHQLALSVRNLAQYFDQYQAYKQARVAARINLDRQLENYRRGRTILLNVLQAITDWGNAVSSESQALTLYNTELANLEQNTGTILETHGIRFMEERFASIGPLGGLGPKKEYPAAQPPGPNADKYPATSKPAEEFFDLEDPLKVKPPPAPRRP
jgi:outer membrane protein TolC